MKELKTEQSEITELFLNQKEKIITNQQGLVIAKIILDMKVMVIKI